MSLSDTAEYWWDIKSHRPYEGRSFRHHPHYACSHINPNTGNTETTPYIIDINCFECIEAIKNGNVEGLIDGEVPPTFYMSKKERKEYNKRKVFIEQYGTCSCGSNWKIRTNSKNGDY